MCERTYKIIDWKSCDSVSADESSLARNYDVTRVSGYGIASTTDIVFPKLFHERPESETSIVSIPDLELSDGPLQFCNDITNYEQQTVYQKVANWVLTQRKYFHQLDDEIEVIDDEIEVIDPVDLFHESILNDYLLITESETERRVLLRDFDSHRYRIESIEEAVKTNDYRFLRKPNGMIEIELEPIIHFHKLQLKSGSKHVKKRRDSVSTVSHGRRRKESVSTTISSYVERKEEELDFLGVPRLLENYVILNREGYVVKQDSEDDDAWLAPMEENLFVEKIENEEENRDELDILSSWFSDVYQTDLNADEVRTLVTTNTDLFEKATVISVTNSEDDVWVDAPDIPDWLDEEHEELELFNQPSRPLYYYRDRIKGCYRIIGVEDETVVLFSGNDDDTIFYPSDGKSGLIPGHSSRNSWSEQSNTPVNSDVDRKNDSGIEDIDDIISEEVAIASIAVNNIKVKEGLSTVPKKIKTVTFQAVSFSKHTFPEILLVVTAALLVILSIVLVKLSNGESVQMFSGKGSLKTQVPFDRGNFPP